MGVAPPAFLYDFKAPRGLPDPEHDRFSAKSNTTLCKTAGALDVRLKEVQDTVARRKKALEKQRATVAELRKQLEDVGKQLREAEGEEENLAAKLAEVEAVQVEMFSMRTVEAAAAARVETAAVPLLLQLLGQVMGQVKSADVPQGSSLGQVQVACDLVAKTIGGLRGAAGPAAAGFGEDVSMGVAEVVGVGLSQSSSPGEGAAASQRLAAAASGSEVGLHLPAALADRLAIESPPAAGNPQLGAGRTAAAEATTAGAAAAADGSTLGPTPVAGQSLLSSLLAVDQQLGDGQHDHAQYRNLQSAIQDFLDGQPGAGARGGNCVIHGRPAAGIT